MEVRSETLTGPRTIEIGRLVARFASPLTVISRTKIPELNEVFCSVTSGLNTLQTVFFFASADPDHVRLAREAYGPSEVDHSGRVQSALGRFIPVADPIFFLVNSMRPRIVATEFEIDGIHHLICFRVLRGALASSNLAADLESMFELQVERCRLS